MHSSEITRRYRVRRGGTFRLKDFDPADTCGLDLEKGAAKELLAGGVKRLAALQERLYADHRVARRWGSNVRRRELRSFWAEMETLARM